MRANFVSVHAATVAMVLALGGATAATAAPGSLQGRYGLSGMGACLASPAGFDPITNVALGTSTASSAVNTGVFTFEPDGKGSASVVQTGLNLPPAQATYSSSANITFQFTYELMPGGAMKLNMLLDTYKATYLTGPFPGLSTTLVAVPPPPPPLSPTWVMSGTISNDRKTLLLNSGDTVLKSRASNGFEVYVICQFERVLTRLTP